MEKNSGNFTPKWRILKLTREKWHILAMLSIASCHEVAAKTMAVDWLP
jgi:hypothetical protein